MTMKFPPLWFLIAMTAIGILNGLPILEISARGMGWAGMIGGVALFIWSLITFKRHDTPIHPGQKPRELIRSGPYKLNRNPIYSAMVLACVGYGILHGSLLGLIPAGVLFWALNKHFAEPEEQAVIDAFGQAGQDYVDTVRRW